MSDAMAANEEDKTVANDAKFFYTVDKSKPISLGIEASFKKRQPQFNQAFLQHTKRLEPPESMAQQLVLGPREETHEVILWNKDQWAEKIR